MRRNVSSLLLLAFATVALGSLGMGCIETKHEIEVKPIQIKAEVNVNLKIDKSLDEFFDDIDE